MTASKKKIIVFTGPSLSVEEASIILEADYRAPIKRGDIIEAIKDSPEVIGIIDGVFHQQPAVSHREILEALKKGIKVVGGFKVFPWKWKKKLRKLKKNLKIKK